MLAARPFEDLFSQIYPVAPRTVRFLINFNASMNKEGDGASAERLREGCRMERFGFG